MALAILEYVSNDRSALRFTIDIGTNSWYRYKIGKSIGRRDGIEWIDDVSYTSIIFSQQAKADFLNSVTNIQVPAKDMDRLNCFIQLFSFKNKEGLAPAFSKVLQVPVSFPNSQAVPFGRSKPFSIVSNMNPSFNLARRIPNEVRGLNYSEETSVDGFLGRLVSLTFPVVIPTEGLVYQPETAHRYREEPGASAGSLYNLLHSLLFRMGAIRSGYFSQEQALYQSAPAENRFAVSDQHLSNPFSFLEETGETDVREWSGWIPHLINTANALRMRMRHDEDARAEDLLSGLAEKILVRRLLHKLFRLELEKESAEHPIGGATADPDPITPSEVNRTADALKTEVDDKHSITDNNIANRVTIAKSLSASENSAPSSNVLLTFEKVTPITWNGKQRAVYNRNAGLTFRLGLALGSDKSSTSLPKAIFTFQIKKAHSQEVLFEKIFKRKDISPGTPLEFSFEKEEIGTLQLNTPLNIFADMRWLSSGNPIEIHATGSTKIILAGDYFIADQGSEVSGEMELSDMKVYRPFWNKIWESPVIDQADGKNEDDKKYGWALDVNGKYFMVLTPHDESNGLMETEVPDCDTGRGQYLPKNSWQDESWNRAEYFRDE